MTDAQMRIDRAHTAFDHYGYIVLSGPIPGMEQVYAAALWAGVDRIEAALGHHRGKAAMKWLHATMPVPCWGVELKA